MTVLAVYRRSPDLGVMDQSKHIYERVTTEHATVTTVFLFGMSMNLDGN
jgi:hypothetical protein